MAKKTENTIAPAKPVKRLVATAPKEKTAKKPAAPKAKRATAPKTRATAAKARKPAPRYTREDVALRAYFIAEKRHAHGLPGSEHQDWLEAERQLAAEAGKSRKTATA